MTDHIALFRHDLAIGIPEPLVKAALCRHIDHLLRLDPTEVPERDDAIAQCRTLLLSFEDDG